MSDNANTPAVTAPSSAARPGPEKKHGSVPPILLQASPHIVSPVNSAALMGYMLMALAPVSVFGIVIFGLPALLNIIVSVTAAVAAEALFRLAVRQPVRITDLSAGVTGLLLALVIPPTMPLWMTALGAIFAVIAAKEFFGGLGANVFNPALAGRAFLLMSFPAAMTVWKQPSLPLFSSFTADAVTGASPLGILKTDGLAGAGGFFAAAGLSPSDSYWQTIKTLFFGYRAGCTGETSILLLLAAFVFLLVKKTIDWRAPVSMIAAGIAAAFVLRIDPLFAIFSGGFMFGAVYMVTDYVTAPLTTRGKVIFGAGAGIIAIVIRKWGGYPEGVSYAILIMNGVVPFLNKLLPEKYGHVPKKKMTADAGKGVVK
ncbi:MAG: RnfABCDGE type electron transport complex subunit D [Treponema sp.]|jgi:electron transport complex protein RnfD|nr:RnfABCDGE type electron transport complex subunit D [Treponema sp.]